MTDFPVSFPVLSCWLITCNNLETIKHYFLDLLFYAVLQYNSHVARWFSYCFPHWFTCNPFTTARANMLTLPFLAVNCQLLELEGCSNPLWFQQVFWLTSKKNIFCFGFKVFWGNVTSTGVFALFWPSLPGPSQCFNGSFFGFKV